MTTENHQQDCLSLCRSETEWLEKSPWHVGGKVGKFFILDGVQTNLKARGVQDILITCTDNLNEFTDTIRAVFPQSSTQIYVVHQIRNSCKYCCLQGQERVYGRYEEHL